MEERIMKPQGLVRPIPRDYLLDCIESPKVLREAMTEGIYDISVTLKSPIRDAFDYHFASLGKLVRANLAFQAARANGLSLGAAYAWALSIELIHNASLIHDDICDSDTTRRGQLTVREKYGSETAICLGDTVLAQSFSVLAQEPQLTRFIPAIAAAVSQLSAGQAIEFSNDFEFDWANYEELIEMKTAPLFKLPVLGLDCDSEKYASSNQLLERYFSLAALAYQIKNDIEDVEDGIKGSSIGHDFKDGRPNAVSVAFCESKSITRASHLNEVSHSADQHAVHGASSAPDLKEQWHALLESDALIRTKNRVTKIVEEAQTLAGKLPIEERSLIAPIESCFQTRSKSFHVNQFHLGAKD